MSVFVVLFDIAVVGAAAWLLLGTSLQSRAPEVKERGRLSVMGDKIVRRRTGVVK